MRHAHRTVSSSGASVSEPEVSRPLITPDEAMRLGASEALIFTSGRPAIRATKLRYYADPSFKQLAQIPPPSKSDRIEHASTIVEVTEEPKSDRESDTSHEQETEHLVVTTRSRQAKSVPAEQLSFLKFPVETARVAADPPKEEGIKERLL